ncbi:hypothetical protein ACQKN7_09730 [Bacillus cereus]|uniref:hypothetical protein n=1 Tax=Bacillus cereus TaxID=1396 RepID=UPI003D060059
MKYTWEKATLEKYGEKVTLQLVQKQKAYEEKKKNNDCEHCGKRNEGAIVEVDLNKSILIHYGQEIVVRTAANKDNLLSF